MAMQRRLLATLWLVSEEERTQEEEHIGAM